MESDGIQLDFQLVRGSFFSDHVRVVSDLRIRNPQTSVDVSRREGIWNFILYFCKLERFTVLPFAVDCEETRKRQRRRVEKHTLVHANRNAFIRRGDSNSISIG